LFCSLSALSWPPRPPRSTLSPYTTLFRSLMSETPLPLRQNRDFMLLQSGQLLSTLGNQASAIAYPLLTLSLTHSPAKAGLAAFADRKSTRLNSSHDQISYAVFCLKKKKNI